MIATLLGGHTAEELIFNEVTTGAQDDIERATKLARKMVTDYGMSDTLGPRTFGQKEEMVFLGREISEQRDYSDKVAEQIDEEVHNIIQEAYEAARKVLTENKLKLIQITQKLIAAETLEGEELEALFSGSEVAPPPKATAEPSPTPVEATTKTKPVPKAKKAPAIPHSLPKQAPAASD
jgi:cell division protease FtsH